MSPASSINNIEAEAGVVASVVMNPELIFFSEQLKPNHFTSESNAYIYYAVCELARRGVIKVDAYNIINFLNSKKGTKQVCDDINGIITIQSLQELFDNAVLIARDSPEDYKVIASAVISAAFRRETYQKLVDCERLCFKCDDSGIEQKIYSTLDEVMMQYSTTTEVPQFKDVIDSYWQNILDRQNPETLGAMNWKFPTLNNYVLIERGELIIFGAIQKSGKSIMMLNTAVDLMKQGKRILYIDSELNSTLFTCRILSHITGIQFKKIRSGNYSESEGQLIKRAIEWLKSQNFEHIYMPVFNQDAIYTMTKKVYHQYGLDVLIVDYFKSSGDDGDAYNNYAKMGALVDLVKNRLAGELNIAAIGAAQATSTGKLSDSAKIARNASTIIMLEDKTVQEIERDGAECGNKKLVVKFNRNGSQMLTDDEYIDLNFNGDTISFEEAKQHMMAVPF